MRVLVTGGGGQLAEALIRAAPAGWSACGLARAELDITDIAAVRRAIDRTRPSVVINAAAFTNVDRADREADAAFRVNRDGAAAVAAGATAAGARLVQVSTDFVFDGALGRPYRPDDPPCPLSVYGASKLAGEQAALAAAPEALIVRSAWVYSSRAGNFMTTMLKLMAEGGSPRVVDDQVGTPTSAGSLAQGLWRLIERGTSGVLHLTDAGVASRYDFAVAIAEEALAAGLIATAPRIIPVPTSDFPTPAARPTYGVLDKAATWAILGGVAAHWRAVLRGVIGAMAA